MLGVIDSNVAVTKYTDSYLTLILGWLAYAREENQSLKNPHLNIVSKFPTVFFTFCWYCFRPARFKFLSAETLRNQVFWDVTPFRWASGSQWLKISWYLYC